MAEDSRKRTKRATTWTRSKRSCRFCSIRKQRCELPQTTDNFETVFSRCLDNETALPEDLRCERCQFAGRDCIPAVPGYGRAKASTQHQQSGRPNSTTATTTTTATDPSSTAESTFISAAHESSHPRTNPTDDGPSRENANGIPNTSLSGLIRDIPSEEVSSALFPHCSGVFPREIRLSPLAILPCLCKDIAPRQRTFRAELDKHESPCCDMSAPLHLLVDPDAMQLLFDCFPGFDGEFFASLKKETPILSNTIKFAAAFVCTGRHRFLKGCSDNALFIMLACAPRLDVALVMTFLASYPPLEIAPIMPPAHDQNIIGFTETVNGTGLLRMAGVCARRATFSRPSAAYLRILNSELTRSFLLGESLADNYSKLEEMKRDLARIRPGPDSRIAIAVMRCRAAMLEPAFETQDYLTALFARHARDMTRWDVPSPLPLSFTDDLRARCRAALSAFCHATNVDEESSRHPVLSSMHALAARLELVILIKAHYGTMEPLVRSETSPNSSTPTATNSWRFIAEGLAAHSADPKFSTIWKFRGRTMETARRLLVHANEALDTRFPTVVVTREMLTAIALASKQLLETHVGLLAMRQHDEDEMRRDGGLLRMTAGSLGRAETILAKALAGTVESMSKALRTWQNKLVRMNVGEKGGGASGTGSTGVAGSGQNSGGSVVGGSAGAVASPVYDPVRQTTTTVVQTPQTAETAIPTPPSDAVLSDQTMNIISADWDGVLTDLLGPEVDWNWFSF